MSIGNISDVLSQVSQIEQQIQQLESGSLLDSMLGVSPAASTDSSSSSSGTSAADFSDALAQAQVADTGSGATSSSTDGSFGSLADSALAPTAAPTTGDSPSALSLLSGGVGLAGGGATLPASASTLLTAGQQQFASTLSADTGLNPSVVTSWLLAEESGSSAQSREATGNNDWLNVGYTGSGTYGASDPIWSDPVTAANATAQWLQGQDSVAGYGPASSSIHSILSTVGQTPAAQIQAIQGSGWSSGGYPNLDDLYVQVAA